jgi:Bacterial Ig-like domain (group 3)
LPPAFRARRLHIDFLLKADEGLMPYLARPSSRESRRRAVAVRYAPAVLEALEERTMLSGTGASLAMSDAMIASKTTMIDSTSTAVTGALVAFTATVENARTGAPITSGKFSFVVESPKKTVLQDVTVNSLGQATIGTKDLTDIANYKIVAQYIPTNSAISASTSAPLTIKVIPVPLNVPTAISLSSIGHTAEVGQYVPLVANVADAGTGTQVDAGLIEPITGKVAFLTDSPNPIVLGEVTVNKDGQATLPTNMLKNLGTYQIIAEFLPFNNYYAQSTSAPISLTILPQTVDAPTVTTLQTSTGLIETGEPLQFTASVQNANSSLSGGVVELVTVSKHPQVLTEAPVGTFGTPLYFSSFKLQKPGNYEVEAEYIPNSNRFAQSTSAPVTVTITPLLAAKLRVTPLVRHGHLGEPIGFTVTAVNAAHEPLTDYTGTVLLTSPTDSWTVFSKAVYIAAKTPPPSDLSPTLARFSISSYTFTPADMGSHTFYAAVIFEKGGAETVRATQANDPKVFGTGTFSIE